MSVQVRAVDYFTTTAHGSAEAAYELLTHLAGGGVNLLAFNAIPVGIGATQLVLFPEDAAPLQAVAGAQGLELAGPDRALLIQGDDELGALARIHRLLAAADVQPYASAGLTDGRGGFAYVVYVRRDQFAAAADALGV